MKIVALISTYEEDPGILQSCIDSAEYLDYVLIFDGPIGSDKDIYSEPILDFSWQSTIKGEWKTDASKRTQMLEFAKESLGEDYEWALWLDSDEILLWGQYLKDLCGRAEYENATGGTTLRIVEYDGSVAECFGKLIRIDAVKRYVMSSYEIELTNGMTVALPNVPLCSMGGMPIGDIKTASDPLLAKNRPPLQGEPHLLHRHGLRNPNRQARRLHATEAESFSDLVKNAGLEKVDIMVDQTAAESIERTK